MSACPAGLTRPVRGDRVYAIHPMPESHRTVERVTRILETVVYRPGVTLAELARTLEAPKSSVHGFVRGLLAQGWLYEQEHRFYLGPAVYSLTLASGHIRAGLVTHADLSALHKRRASLPSSGSRPGTTSSTSRRSGATPWPDSGHGRTSAVRC